VDDKFLKGVVKFREDVKRLFNMTRRDILEYVLVPYGLISVDVIAFDYELHKRHGDYEKDGMSMMAVVRKEYGEEAAKWLKDNVETNQS